MTASHTYWHLFGPWHCCHLSKVHNHPEMSAVQVVYFAVHTDRELSLEHAYGLLLFFSTLKVSTHLVNMLAFSTATILHQICSPITLHL